MEVDRHHEHEHAHDHHEHIHGPDCDCVKVIEADLCLSGLCNHTDHNHDERHNHNPSSHEHAHKEEMAHSWQEEVDHQVDRRDQYDTDIEGSQLIPDELQNLPAREQSLASLHARQDPEVTGSVLQKTQADAPIAKKSDIQEVHGSQFDKSTEIHTQDEAPKAEAPVSARKTDRGTANKIEIPEYQHPVELDQQEAVTESSGEDTEEVKTTEGRAAIKTSSNDYERHADAAPNPTTHTGLKGIQYDEFVLTASQEQNIEPANPIQSEDFELADQVGSTDVQAGLLLEADVYDDLNQAVFADQASISRDKELQAGLLEFSQDLVVAINKEMSRTEDILDEAAVPWERGEVLADQAELVTDSADTGIKTQTKVPESLRQSEHSALFDQTLKSEAINPFLRIWEEGYINNKLMNQAYSASSASLIRSFLGRLQSSAQYIIRLTYEVISKKEVRIYD